ncbi:MAG: hypothetical protein VX589_19685 [Myxococcota bacterium]|nr:hypothetical protein [Myxococcota bacterium]
MWGRLICAAIMLMFSAALGHAEDDESRVGRVSKRKATSYVEETAAELIDAQEKLGTVTGRVRATLETALRHQSNALKHLNANAYKNAFLASMRARKFVDLLTRAAATKIEMEQTAETMGAVTGTTNDPDPPAKPAVETNPDDALARAQARLAAAEAKALAINASTRPAPAPPKTKPSPKPMGVLVVQLQIGQNIPVAAARSMNDALRTAIEKLTPIASIDVTNKALRDSGTSVVCTTDACAEQLTSTAKKRFVLFSHVGNEDEIYTVKLMLYDKTMSSRIKTIEAQCELCAASEVDKTIETAAAQLESAFKAQKALHRKSCIRQCDTAFRARLDDGLTKETATYFLEKCLAQCR